jgi:predicted transcriptional regulator of viral defense system
MNGSRIDIVTQIRREISGDVFDYQVLSNVLSGYRKPRDVITRLLKRKIIIRIKKGLYCFGDYYRNELVSREYLANLIYGPSYVSLDYALSFHNLIPERVEMITSVTTCRSKDFDTSLGTFSYRMLTGDRYACGVMLEISDKISFLMATPEKAIIDKIWCDKRFAGLRILDYESYLLEDLRMDLEMLCSLDYVRLESIRTVYNSEKINNFIRFLKHLKGGAHA